MFLSQTTVIFLLSICTKVYSWHHFAVDTYSLPVECFFELLQSLRLEAFLLESTVLANDLFLVSSLQQLHSDSSFLLWLSHQSIHEDFFLPGHLCHKNCSVWSRWIFFNKNKCVYLSHVYWIWHVFFYMKSQLSLSLNCHTNEVYLINHTFMFYFIFIKINYLYESRN